MDNKKAVEYLDKIIEAHKQKTKEINCLEDLSDESICFCNSSEAYQIHIFQGIEKLADALSVETEVEVEPGSSPVMRFHYNGIKFFQLGDIDYTDVKVVFK